MVDGKLRELERDAAEHAVQLLRARVRAGELTQAHVAWAARLGHPTAAKLHGDPTPEAGDAVVERCLRETLLSTDQRNRFAISCAHRVVPLFARSLPSQVVPEALNVLSRGPSLLLDLASMLPNLPQLSQQRHAAVFQCFRALRAALDGDASAAARASLYALPADDQHDELSWQRNELATLLLE